MAASKITNYSSEILNLSTIGKALAHPARVKIIMLLEEGNLLTNQELCEVLKLNKATVHTHLKKIYEAGLIRNEYRHKFAVLSRTNQHEELIRLFCENVREKVQQ